MRQRRTVFFVSDQTGVTAETMGHSLLTQFDGLDFRPVTLPFITTLDKAQEAVGKINQAGREEGARPVVFATFVNNDVRDVLRHAACLFLDFFDAFLDPLEKEFSQPSAHVLGRAHGMTDLTAYTMRINATNFALANDDGAQTGDYDRADVILVGVSRSCNRGLSRPIIRSPRRIWTAAGCRRRSSRTAASCLAFRSRQAACTRSVRNGAPTAAMRHCRNVCSRCASPSSFSSVTTFHFSKRPTARSRKSPAA